MYFLWYIVSENSIILSQKYIVAFDEISNTNLSISAMQWLLIFKKIEVIQLSAMF